MRKYSPIFLLLLVWGEYLPVQDDEWYVGIFDIPLNMVHNMTVCRTNLLRPSACKAYALLFCLTIYIQSI